MTCPYLSNSNAWAHSNGTCNHESCHEYSDREPPLSVSVDEEDLADAAEHSGDEGYAGYAVNIVGKDWN